MTGSCGKRGLHYLHALVPMPLYHTSCRYRDIYYLLIWGIFYILKDGTHNTSDQFLSHSSIVSFRSGFLCSIRLAISGWINSVKLVDPMFTAGSHCSFNINRISCF